MHKKYRFNGLERKHNILILCVGVGLPVCVGPFLAIFTMMNIFSVVSIAILMMAAVILYMFIVCRFLDVRKHEYWEISFDEQTIYITSNKRPQIVINYAELTSVQLTSLYSQGVIDLSIRFTTTESKLHIHVIRSIKRSVVTIKDLAMFRRLTARLVPQLLQSGYQITKHKPQSTMRSSRYGDFHSAAKVVIQKSV